MNAHQRRIARRRRERDLAAFQTATGDLGAGLTLLAQRIASAGVTVSELLRGLERMAGQVCWRCESPLPRLSCAPVGLCEDHLTLLERRAA